MCNCGNKRNDYAAAAAGSFIQTTNKNGQQNLNAAQDVYFEYLGKTALTVTGNVSGKRYRFSEPGDKQIIYYRDTAGMMRVPILRLVQDNLTQ